MPTTFVRIQDTHTGLETSVSEARAEQLVGRGGVTILTATPAVDRLGRPLPASQPAAGVASSTGESEPVTAAANTPPDSAPPAPAAATKAKIKEQS